MGDFTMGIWKRIFGISDTFRPQDPDSWKVEGEQLILDLQRLPELHAPGGAVRLEGKSLARRLLIVHGNDGAYHVFENRCTHMGRRLDPLEGREQVRCCSVSKSTFDYEGKPVSGAARKPVHTFEARETGGRLVVNLTPSAAA